MVQETGEADLFLRRYISSTEGGKCEQNSYGYHNASVPVGRAPAIWRRSDFDDELYFHCDPTVESYKGDPRWPTHCVCGYEFQQEDHWQVHHEIVFTDGSSQWNMRQLPIGAMFEVKWAFSDWVGPDGKHLAVILPPGRNNLLDIWQIDGPSRSGGRWTRTGQAPNLTVQPSILTDKYHGFLQDGQLTDSLGDRPLQPGPW